MGLLIKNGLIYNSENCNIYIEDGIIKAVGNKELEELENEDTEVIDAGGKLILPGLNDSHMHLSSLGTFLNSVNCHGLTSIADVIAKGKEFINQSSLAENELIYGMGWNQDYFTDEVRHLNRFDLDDISTTHPIIFRRACGHLTTCNTKALELLNIDENTLQVAGGEFEVDKNGFPTGIFNENAMQLLIPLMPKSDVEQLKKNLRPAIAHALKNGITSVGSNDFNAMENVTDSIIQAFQELESDGELNLRVNLQCCFGDTSSFNNFIKQEYYTGYGTDNFRIGGLKLFIDGSLGARTALMRAPYADDSTTTGVQCISNDMVDEMVQVANENGFQVIVHAIGDKAIEVILDSYEKVLGDSENRLRHGINHCQITDYGILQRFSNKDILAYVQPIFLHYDMHIVEDRVGKDLASTSYAFNTMEKLEIHTSYGTDAPIEDLNPFECIHCAVNRQDLNYYPENGFYPSECVSVETAVNNYTKGGAYASFEEDIKGSLDVGMLADLIIVDRNIYEVDSAMIKDTEVEYTIFNGNVVYQK